MSEKSMEQKRAERLSAYAWASRRMHDHYDNPDHYRLKDIDEAVMKVNSHISLFRGLKKDPVIIRTYWHDTKSEYFAIVDNYNEMRTASVDYVELLERTGIFVYEQAMQSKKARSNRQQKRWLM